MLIINDEVRSEIEKVKQFAVQHPISTEDIQKIVKGEMPPPGDVPYFTCMIPIGFKAVYTIEYQPAGECEHISISTAACGQMPTNEEVEQITEAFGIKWVGDVSEPVEDPSGLWNHGMTYHNDLGNGHVAFNIVVKK